MDMENSTATILLGEDNPADVYLIRQALEEHGIKYRLEIASHGGEMISALTGRRSAPPDLIVLDLNLPRYDGLEILKTIREDSGLKDIPVVILTSSDSPKDRVAASEFGADCYIRKPSKLDEFMAIGATLQSLLNTRQRAATH
jgi:chemotaxis family two-component system response regulator Rcp1